MVTEKKTTKKPAATKAAAPAAAAPAAAMAGTQPEDTRNALQKRRTVVGEVVSNKMQKTIVVKVDRRVRHGLYKKYIVRSRRFKAHDEKNDAKVGDRVILTESRPMSRDKRWVLTTIVRRAGQTQDANV
jgi:small subunit ribosomal protein S17